MRARAATLPLVRKLSMRVNDDDDGRTEQQAEIEKWWRDSGYFHVETRIQALPTALDAAQQHVLLKIHVDEGAQYRLGGSVGFRSSEPEQPLVFPESRLMQTVKLGDGDVFSSLAIRGTLDALKQLYASHGYIDFVATPITEIDETTRRVTLMMELDQEKQYRVGRVEIHATSPQVRAAIAAKLKTGDIFDRSALQDVLKQNASLLPPDVSERDVSLGRDKRLGMVNLWFDLETCPQSPPK
jgi:outer membrane protein assembly factor BamA